VFVSRPNLNDQLMASSRTLGCWDDVCRLAVFFKFRKAILTKVFLNEASRSKIWTTLAFSHFKYWYSRHATTVTGSLVWNSVSWFS